MNNEEKSIYINSQSEYYTEFESRIEKSSLITEVSKFLKVSRDQVIRLLNGKSDPEKTHPDPKVQYTRVLKGVSDRLLREEFWSQMKTMLWGDHFWSPSYCAVSARGAPLEVIKKYIKDQNRPTTSMQIDTSKADHAIWNTH